MSPRRAVPAILAVALGLAGCPAASNDPPPSGTGQPPPGAGGTLTIAYPWEPPTLDPYTEAGSSLPTRDLVRLVMPSLTGEHGLIAGDPTIDAGPPYTVTLRLRDDARWSDGRPVSVRDLVRTLRHAQARRPGTAASVRAIDEGADGAVRITFDAAPARWQDVFSGGEGILPAHALGRGAPDRTWRVSGGPFVLARWRAGLDMRFERNDRWWGPRSHLQRIRVVFVPDASAALDLLRAGRVDALGPYHSPDWQRRVRDAGAQLVVADGSSTAVRLILAARGPLSDAAVRRAFLEAADLRRIVRGLVQAEAHQVPEPPTRRLADARSRLDRAGWRGSPTRSRSGRTLTFTFAVVIADDLGFVVARAMKFQAEDAGIRAEVIGLEDRRFWGEWLLGEELRAALVTSRDPDARGALLYRPVVALAASDGVTLDAAGGPGGPFARAFLWARAA